MQSRQDYIEMRFTSLCGIRKFNTFNIIWCILKSWASYDDIEDSKIAVSEGGD